MPVKPVKLSLDSGDMAIPPIYVTNCGLLLKKTLLESFYFNLINSTYTASIFLFR